MTDLGNRHESDEEERRRLGDRLREARKYLGLKQEEVASYLKIPRTALTDIENGQRRVEAIELARLAANLSQQDRDELGRFAEYLRARSLAARQ